MKTNNFLCRIRGLLVLGLRLLLIPGLRLPLHIVQAVKDAASDVRLHSALFFSMMGKLAWALPLLIAPHMFRALPGVYRGFETVATEHQWAGVLFVLMAIDLYGITRRTYWPQIIGLLLGAFVWFFFSCVITQGLPRAAYNLPMIPGGYLYLFAGAGCFISLFRTAQRHQAEMEADNYLLLVHEVKQAQARGELWTKAKHKTPGDAQEQKDDAPLQADSGG